MRFTIVLLSIISLAVAGCGGSTDPVLLDTDSGEDADAVTGEDLTGDDTLVEDDTPIAPDVAQDTTADDTEEDAPLPCGCQSDEECAPATPEPCVEWHCIEGADGCGFCGQGPLDCDDGEACTEDSCDVDTGDCVHAPMDEGEACDDGDLCTLADECDADGACVGEPLDCDDLNGCTLDTCDPDTGECDYENVEVPCDDGDACTEGDFCADGICQPGPDELDCDDGNKCTTSACDPAIGECVYFPSGEPGCCEAAADCDDANPCTADTCDSDDGSCANIPVPNAPCDDNDACTTGDACDEDGACLGAPVDCDDGNECTGDACDPATGCVYEIFEDGICDDGSVCTQGDACSDEGVCIPGQAISCDDLDACTDDFCDPLEGCMNIPVPQPDCCNTVADCDDGDECTDDACEDNTCVHSPVISPECCLPDCDDKECGPDGCGGVCGVCLEGYCDAGLCFTVCVPDCAGLSCGPDGCGGSCGACGPGFSCGETGQCEPCEPLCDPTAECGLDGCAGVCDICPGGETCTPAGGCVSACDCVGDACWGDGFEGANPGEGGTLAGWMWTGDAQVIEHLGATPAPEGDSMALVSTGLMVQEDGKLWRAFCPPPGAAHLEFSWRFYSEEFKEWCGSSYQDNLEVFVAVGPAVESVFSLTVNDLCPPGECYNCGAQFVGLFEADVSFDQGGVWMTPWQTASVPLPAGLDGEEFTVWFEVSDAGDSIYDTVVLIDDVHIIAPPPCETVEDCDDGNPCTDDLCDPLSGLCSNVMIPGCCQTDGECTDGDVCTIDACVDWQCVNTFDGTIPGCCQIDEDCDDGDPCTDDLCYFTQCWHTPNSNPGCCEPEVLLYEDFDDGAAQGWTLEPEQSPFGMGWVIGGPGHSEPNSLQGGGTSIFPGMESIATTPTVTLPGGQQTTLDFWYRGLSDQIQCPADALIVRIGTAVIFSGCQQSSGWLHASVDISDLAPAEVAVEFRPGGGGGMMPLPTYAIDDVVIETTCDPVPVPSF